MDGIRRVGLAAVASLVVLCGAVSSLRAEITCYPGVKVYSTGTMDNWICWDGIADNCESCYDEIVVKG